MAEPNAGQGKPFGERWQGCSQALPGTDAVALNRVHSL